MLRNSKHFLSALFDTIAEGIVIRDDSGQIVDLNERALEIFKLSRAQMLGEEATHPDWLIIKPSGEQLGPEEFPGFRTAITGEPVNNFMLGLKNRDDKPVWIRINSRSIVIDEIKYVISSFLDETEKYELEKLQKENETRWQLALNSSGLGVWDWDVKSGKLFFTDEWRKILDYGAGELSDHISVWEDSIHPDDKPAVFKALEDYFTGKVSTYDIEHRLRSKNGSYRWTLTSGKIISREPDGSPSRLIGTIRDIHSRKEVMEKLRISESTLSNTFQLSAIGLGLVAPNGTWMNVNPALCELLGYTKDELLQKTFQDITHPDDLQADLDYVQQMLNREISSYQMEKRYIMKNGHYVWAMLTVSLVWEEDEPQFFISQIVDISNIKHMIGELEWKNATLNTVTLDLENKIGQLEEFTRIVAHNLRGPAGNINLLLKALADSEQELKSSPYFEMLLQSCQNLSATLDELMKIVELRLNRNIQFEECLVKDLLQKVIVSLKGDVLEKNVVIEERIEEPVISFPKIYLHSILYNLVSNAIKYSRADVTPHIIISTYKENGQTVLTVEDNGLGIDLDKYGNQVFKLKKVFHKGFDSKGVGLFLIKNQVETFGGSINVSSTPMKGSAFTVTF
ncbi:PAS domain-containing protein [Rufibacter roseus]|uniref:histidine kinase n=1 Tax=Rufibacter roseus TaxID=1567108 RepID=A0ABW2DP25_9BACT|nr:PAS domain S-box protein [Rufibacter roseus]